MTLDIRPPRYGPDRTKTNNRASRPVPTNEHFSGEEVIIAFNDGSSLTASARSATTSARLQRRCVDVTSDMHCNRLIEDTDRWRGVSATALPSCATLVRSFVLRS